MPSDHPPTIVVGMHRSGTSWLADLLHDRGIFMGSERDVHGEAEFFKQANQHVFRIAHATWDHPEPVERLVGSAELRPRIVELLRGRLASREAEREYWGTTGLLQRKPARSPDAPWGWKDPRSSFTLPFWLDLFPAARVVHIHRNGVDVAASLQARERARRDPLRNPLFSARCLELEGGFSLWVSFVETCRAHLADLPPERACELAYEEVLRDPRPHLARLFRFLGLGASEERVEAAAAGLEPDRAYAFLRHDDRRRFYETCRGHPLMTRLGYGAIEPDE